MKLVHTRLLASNFAACFLFYRDVMQLRPSWGDENDNYASFTHAGEETIALALFDRQAMADVVGRGDWPREAPAQDRGMLSFSVPNVDEMVEVLKQQDIQLVKEPADFPDWGIRSAYLRDPDGNLIELGSELRRTSWSEGLRNADEKWHPANE
jgi:lactoylglutathione lyase